MNEELIQAFNTIYDAMFDRVSDADVAPMDEAIEKIAKVVLTDDEFIEYTEGYDKDGNAVIGR